MLSNVLDFQDHNIFQIKKKILLKKAQKGTVINDQHRRANIF